MARTDALADRRAFAERLRLQVAARCPGSPVEADPSQFALRVGGATGATISLAPLHQACVRSPAQTTSLIADFVASIDSRLSATAPLDISASRLLWCVRAAAEIVRLRRADDLVTVDVGAGLTAFVAESLPGSIMRGVPRQDAEAIGLSESEARSAASRNTDRRFERLLQRIRAQARVPADGWRMAGDPLFQGSVLMVPALLGALRDLAGGDVLLAVPDRGVALAIAARLPGAARFGRRVLREWREAMHPCSRELLITDGAGLRAVPRRRPGARSLVMPWLQE